MTRVILPSRQLLTASVTMLMQMDTTISIFVKNSAPPNNIISVLHVEPNAHIHSIHKKIQSFLQNNEQFQLQYDNATLDNTKTLTHYNIKDNSTIFVLHQESATTTTAAQTIDDKQSQLLSSAVSELNHTLESLSILEDCLLPQWTEEECNTEIQECMSMYITREFKRYYGSDMETAHSKDWFINALNDISKHGILPTGVCEKIKLEPVMCEIRKQLEESL